MDSKKDFQPLSSQTFLSMTQLLVCWTPRDPSLKQRMKKIMILWMIFGSKLLSSFLMLAIYSFIKYLRYRQTQTSSGNVENIHRKFGSPLRDPFFDPSPPFSGFW